MRSFVPILFLAVAMCVGIADAGERPTLVRVEVGDRAEARVVGGILVLDEKTRGTTLFGWGTVKEIEAVEKLGYLVEVVPPEPKDIEALTMCSEAFAAPFPWNCYPTWSQFETMMQYYATTYPGIARLVNLGMSGQGDHELWALKISDNPDAEEDEPEILYTGTMHGDELVCYGTTVHLIDHMLAGYGSDAQITRLINETVLWFNPLSNPDGTFAGGDLTVAGATRYLPASGSTFDPNRNFPDPSVPDDISSSGWATEIQVMMDFASAEHFTLAANCHGGAEVFNYPWDVWSVRPVDDDWWIAVGTAYASSAQDASPSGYLTMCPGDCPYPGVTNGYDWYTTSGNRQDFMNWYHGCREVTLELADAKDLDATLLDAHFDYNRQALLDYFDLALTGVRGVVTDAVSGLALEAEVRVLGHDTEAQRSWVSTDPEVGDYHRLIEAGTWDLEIRRETYQTQVVYGVVVQPDADATVVDVQLQPSAQVEVTGVIRDGATAMGISYAAVTLIGSADYGPVTADQHGSFTIPDVWQDAYVGRFEAAGYGYLETPIVVSPGSTYFEVSLSPKVTVLTNDFELSDGGLNTVDDWEWGRDTTAGAHSGTKVWGTVLNGNYTNDALWELDTAAIDLTGVDGAELRFWQRYDMEDNYDGGNIEVAADGGVFTLVTPSPDYTHQSLSGLGDEPGFEGSAGWHEVAVDLTPFAGQTVVIRWTLGSDFSETRRGWYLDDMAVIAWGGAIGVDIFADSFESGDSSAWSSVTGEREMARRPAGTIRHPQE